LTAIAVASDTHAVANPKPRALRTARMTAAVREGAA
jgi:hypothetical protein